MDINTAAAIAATTVSGLSAETAKKIIVEFLDRLAFCHVCAGTGTYVVQSLTDIPSSSGMGRAYLSVGQEMRCPQCGDEGGDPTWSHWRCTADQDRSKHQCERVCRGENGCGPAMIIPHLAIQELRST